MKKLPFTLNCFLSFLVLATCGGCDQVQGVVSEASNKAHQTVETAVKLSGVNDGRQKAEAICADEVIRRYRDREISTNATRVIGFNKFDISYRIKKTAAELQVEDTQEGGRRKSIFDVRYDYFVDCATDNGVITALSEN